MEQYWASLYNASFNFVKGVEIEIIHCILDRLEDVLAALCTTYGYTTTNSNFQYKILLVKITRSLQDGQTKNRRGGENTRILSGSYVGIISEFNDLVILSLSRYSNLDMHI